MLSGPVEQIPTRICPLAEEVSRTSGRRRGEETCGESGVATRSAWRVERRIERLRRDKRPGQADAPEVRAIKGLIRRGEARGGCRACGVPMANPHFMDLPFYETGAVP